RDPAQSGGGMRVWWPSGARPHLGRGPPVGWGAAPGGSPRAFGPLPLGRLPSGGLGGLSLRGAALAEGLLEAVELVPLVAQVGRKPQHGPDAQQEQADDAARQDVGQLLGWVRARAHAEPADAQGDGAG